jgi:hypothetical protein
VRIGAAQEALRRGHVRIVWVMMSIHCVEMRTMKPVMRTMILTIGNVALPLRSRKPAVRRTKLIMRRKKRGMRGPSDPTSVSWRLGGSPLFQMHFARSQKVHAIDNVTVLTQ